MEQSFEKKDLHILFHMGAPYDSKDPCMRRIQVFCEVLQKKEYEVTIMVPDCGSTNEDIPYLVRCKTVAMKRKSAVYRFLNSMIFAMTSFWKSLRLGRIDIVLTTSPPPLISMSGWMIAKVKRAKLIYDVRDIWPDVAWEMGSFDEKSIYSRVFQFIRDFMLRHADLVTTVSKGKVKKLNRYAPDSRVVEIANGLDESFLTNTVDERIAAKFHMDQLFTCVYIGNLGLAQGLSQLLYVARQAKEAGLQVQFLLFGRGAEEEALKQRAQKWQLDNVVFAGCLPNHEIYSVLKYAKISFVSLVNEKLKDSVPTKIYEALGAGCPVLLAAAGDAADILKDCGLGISVRPNCEEELWDAFLEMYHGYSKYEKQKKHAAEVIVEKYSRQKAALKLEEQFELLLAR